MIYSRLVSKGRIDQSARGPLGSRDLCLTEDYVSRTSLLPTAKQNAELHLRDHELERLTGRFREVQNHISTLSQYCINYSKGVQAFLEHCVKVNRQFEILLNSPRSWKSFCTTEFSSKRGDYPTVSPLEPLSENYGSDDLIFSISETNPSTRDTSRQRRRQEVAQRLIAADLRMVEQCSVAPLLSITEICKRIACTLQRREILVAGVKERMERLARLENKNRGAPPLGARQQRKMVRIGRDLELEKLKLESLSTTIKVELKVLFKLLDAFVATWAPNFFMTTFSITYTMHRYLGRINADESAPQQCRALPSSPEPGHPKKLSVQGRATQSPHDMSRDLPSLTDIVARFHLDFDSVICQLDTFRVTSFESLYQLTLSSATESAKSYFQDNAVRGTVPTLYATAIFGFSSTEPTHSDDLNFYRNDIIKVIKRNNNGWWYGEAIRTKQRGYFPANCVELERLL
ncbi:LAQU0S01e00650g1_1 [Lachancea quebecensis]|uniref:LAQU0S01e00650g1_1 n=1 Tax=Lachancea quebecensis TaxID=1654605 RepID=A0A0P1KLB6_9SACH|nr:LAQU0S01e00650g1_1 [Lachancea quebecensis]